MNWILREIMRVRQNEPMKIDTENKNRYCVSFYEHDGTKSAYFFATPIYRIHTRKSIDRVFHQNGSEFYAYGSNAYISIKDEIRLENENGVCQLQIGKQPLPFSEHEVHAEDDTITPTTNGILYKAALKGNAPPSFVLKIQNPELHIRANNKCFALMQEKFLPFVTVSCIGTACENGAIIAPAEISYQKINSCSYQLTVIPCSPTATHVLFEVNLYEPKLFQDTTVESANPKMNNAYGGTAFIGHTALFGEQWLYSRPDFSKLQELIDRQINRAVLHIPKYNAISPDISAFRVTSRFCSFGSNWSNKIADGSTVAHAIESKHYQSIDITPLIADTETHYFSKSEGLILKTKEKDSGYSAIATGDNYHSPQFLEINFK